MKIAITGCDGFVGKRLVRRLTDSGLTVIRIDLNYGFDITDFNQLEGIEPFDILIHLAARSFVPDSYRDPRNFYRVNVSGTLNVLELCRKFKAKMIFTSSYVYGIPRYLPIDEKHPLEALNPYAQSKVMGEELCQAYHRDFNLNVIVLRPFNIYGPGQNKNFLIPTILRQAKTGKIVLKDPKPKRDMVFIDDHIEAYIKAINYNFAGFDVFNIGSGQSYSVREIAETAAEILPQAIEIEFSGEQRKTEIPETLADIKKIRTVLGWKPAFSLQEGLQKILAEENSK